MKKPSANIGSCGGRKESGAVFELRASATSIARGKGLDVFFPSLRLLAVRLLQPGWPWGSIRAGDGTENSAGRCRFGDSPPDLESGAAVFFSTKYDGDLFFRDTLEVRSWLIGFSSVKSL